ncbi:protein kinase family protein [Nocardioides ochotonae]|uniref:protein kinase family protein n=1 Tax=Nocardioides ochotonae TaxID=2685869 RepID=UPI00140BCA39|nr:protein kinase family protein [Nocardioides ochotonae]
MPLSNRPGDVLAGRYRLVDLLSESKGGRFWRAHDQVLERHVALHVIDEDDPRAPQLIEAARRSARIHDPRLLRVLDAERTGGLCYVVNEWGSGIALDHLAATHGPLPPRRAAWLVGEVADTMARAHEAGVAHGRLVPENVLVDRTGSVRVIGLAVDAALHGLPTDRLLTDVTNLAGLLYCALTGRWAGLAASDVPPAPTDHGHVLRPRQVRAGVPRPLDALCDELLNPALPRGREIGLRSARDIADFLADFVGDPTGIPEEMAALRMHRRPETVVLPPVPEMALHEPRRSSAPLETEPVLGHQNGPQNGPDPEPDRYAVEQSATTDTTDPADTAPTIQTPVAATSPDATPAGRTATHDTAHDTADDIAADPGDPGATSVVPDGLPTQAGLPVFDDESDDVSWLTRSSEPAPPPPPFEEPPERPLFAPEPPDGAPARRPRHAVPPGTPSDFWPWDTANGRHTGTGIPVIAPEEDTDVPGRRSLRLAMVIAASLLLLIAVVVGINLGRGKTPLGSDPGDDPPRTPDASPAALQPLAVTGARDLDPQGDDGGEYPELTSLATDGDDATAWTTQTYLQQFGPGGLKTGVGLVLDLGSSQDVSEVQLSLRGEPTTVEVFVSDDAPTATPGEAGSPVATQEIGASGKVTLEEPVRGRYVTLWLTSLPSVSDGFRAELAEVVVRG